MKWSVQVDNIFQFVVADSLPVQRSYLKRQRTLRGRLGRGCFHCRGSGETISLGPSKHDTVFFCTSFHSIQSLPPKCNYLPLPLSLSHTHNDRVSNAQILSLSPSQSLRISPSLYFYRNIPLTQFPYWLLQSFVGLFLSPCLSSHSFPFHALSLSESILRHSLTHKHVPYLSRLYFICFNKRYFRPMIRTACIAGVSFSFA